MQFRVQVKAVAGVGWELTVNDPDSSLPDLAPPRIIPASATGKFPIPPVTENLSSLPAAWQAMNEPDLDTAYRRITGGTGGNESAPFGRYLFLTMFGPALWKRIDDAARNTSIEIVLAWDSTQTVLSRLPWEMMRGDGAFLAEDPEISFSRQISDAPAQLAQLTSPPSVLIVIGSRLTNDVIRPGAEFLGLVRGLRANNLSLKLHLLLEANTDTLQAAVKEFRPTVVHFICHGNVNNNGAGYLELVDPKDPNKAVQVYGATLIQALRTDKNLPLPEVVVLNACYTANAKLWNGGQIATPLSVELIGRGVPIVVGMAGRVSDHACRLFTRGFYESLLTTGKIAYATGEGRRAGIRGGINPAQSPDWAFPMLFVSGGITSVSLEVSSQNAEQDWQAVAEQYATPAYPAFCDRLELFQALSVLMASPAAQRTLAALQNDLQVLAISIAQSDRAIDAGPRYGRTWTLKALAAEAIRAGHLPCLMIDDQGFGALKTWPTAFPEFLRFLNRALSVTATHFSLNQPEFKYLEILAQLKPGEPLPPGTNRELANAYVPGDPKDMGGAAKALTLDLLDFLGQPGIPKTAKLLFLIDDVHRMDSAAADLCGVFLGALGIRDPRIRDRVRVIFTTSTVPAAGQQTAVKRIEDFLSEATWVKRKSLDAFGAKLEEQLAYEYFLLRFRDANTDRPLCVNWAEEEHVNAFFESFSEEVEGIPSNLPLMGPKLIKWTLKLAKNTLRPADDEDRLMQARAQKR